MVKELCGPYFEKNRSQIPNLESEVVFLLKIWANTKNHKCKAGHYKTPGGKCRQNTL